MKRIPLNSISAAVYTRLTEYQDVPVYDDVSPRAKPLILLSGYLPVRKRGLRSTTLSM